MEKLKEISEAKRERAFRKTMPPLETFVETPGQTWHGAILSWGLDDQQKSIDLSTLQFCILAKALGIRILPKNRVLMHSDTLLTSLQDLDGQGMRFERLNPLTTVQESKSEAQNFSQWDEAPEDVLFELIMGTLRREQMTGEKNIPYCGTTRYSIITVSTKSFLPQSIILGVGKVQDKGYSVHMVDNGATETMDVVVLWDKKKGV